MNNISSNNTLSYLPANIMKSGFGGISQKWIGVVPTRSTTPI